MQLMFRPALPNDAAGCAAMRGKTRQNALTEKQLRAIGVTAKSWGENIASGSLPGHVCTVDESLVAYCFGSRDTGEIEVLAVLADFEGRGIGRKLLRMMVDTLATLGHKRVFLGCSKNPGSRSYGFYRHLGWRPTGSTDRHGDEILELIIDSPDAERSAAQTR